MAGIMPKPKSPSYTPPPATAQQADMSDPTIARSAAFASRANADSFVGGKLTRKANTAKAELTGG